MVSRNTTLAVLIAVIAVGVVYMIDPTFFGLLGRKEGFENSVTGNTSGPTGEHGAVAGQNEEPGQNQRNAVMANEHRDNGPMGTTSPMTPNAAPAAPTGMSAGTMATEGFENLSPETMPFPTVNKPGNCYPKNQLAPQELLPADPNSKWAQVNPMASGDIAGKNFLNAGALIGVNTVGQSLRNANWDIRAAPPNPQVQVSPWLQSTISPDLERRPLDIA